MQVSVHKWGNSLAVRIPKAFAQEVGLSKDTPVRLSVEEGRLVVTPAASGTYDLAKLLSAVTKKNLHRETDTGRAIGNESW